MNKSIESGPILDSMHFQGENSAVHRIPVATEGATCLTYKLFHDNKFYFQKVLRPELMENQFYHELFRKEFEVGQNIDSIYFPHYDCIKEGDGEVSIIMEFIDGESLEQRLKKNPEYFADKKNLHRFLTQLLSAIEYLHSHQLLHLDLKPSNILLSTVNNDVRIIDLGYCHTDSAPFTEGRTLSYAAPEQMQGKEVLTAQTDIYAIGRIMQCINEHIALPWRYHKIMRKALKENPAERFGSAREMRNELEKSLTKAIVTTMLVLSLLAAILGGLISNKMSDTSGEKFHTVLRDGFVLYLEVLSHDSLTATITAAPNKNIYKRELYLPPTVEYKGETYTITTVSDSAFMGCDSLYTVSLPKTIIHIGNDAFRDCPRLRTMTLPTALLTLGEYVFAADTTLESITIPPSLSIIPRGCFLDCYNLEDVHMPVSIEEIKQDAFVSCLSLEDMQLPDSLKKLERGVFFNCRNLVSVTLPESIRFVGVYAFMECPKLKQIVCQSTTPPEAANIFDRDGILLLVPEGKAGVYRQAAGWKKGEVKVIH